MATTCESCYVFFARVRGCESGVELNLVELEASCEAKMREWGLRILQAGIRATALSSPANVALFLL